MEREREEVSVYRSYCMYCIEKLLYVLYREVTVCTVYRSYCMYCIEKLLYVLYTEVTVCTVYRSYCMYCIQKLLYSESGGEIRNLEHERLNLCVPKL